MCSTAGVLPTGANAVIHGAPALRRLARAPPNPDGRRTASSRCGGEKGRDVRAHTLLWLYPQERGRWSDSRFKAAELFPQKIWGAG